MDGLEKHLIGDGAGVCSRPSNRKWGSLEVTRNFYTGLRQGYLPTQNPIEPKGLFKNLASGLTPDERLALVERDMEAAVPLLWQADLLSVSRSRLYYAPRPAREQEIRVKHRLDE